VPRSWSSTSRRPRRCRSAGLLTADLTNPDFFDAAGGLDLAKDTIHIVRAKFIWAGCAYERLAVRNFDTRAHSRWTSLTCSRCAGIGGRRAAASWLRIPMKAAAESG
jgi:hypothetical protein